MFEGIFVGYKEDEKGESVFDTKLSNVTTFAILYPQQVPDDFFVNKEVDNEEELRRWADTQFDEYEIRELT